MPLISSDSTPYGVRKNFTEVPFAAQVGANDKPIFVLAFKDADIPRENTATLTLDTASGERQLTSTAAGTAVVGEDEYKGLYVKYTDDSTSAVLYAQIAGNSAVTTAAGAIVITLEDDLGITPEDGVDTFEIQAFAGFSQAQEHSDLESALNTYFKVDTEGKYQGADHDNVAFDQLSLYAKNGGGPFWVLAAEWDATPATLQANLAETGSTDADVAAALRAIRDAGKICCPKGYTGMLSANNTIVDAAWIDYCDLRATGNSEDLREHVYMMGAQGNTSGAAVSYIQTLAKTSERHAVLWPRVKVTRQDGFGYMVDCAGAYAAMPTRVHALSQEGVGHAIAGSRLTQLAGIVGLEVNPTRAERPSLQAENCNYIANEPGAGTYILGSRTGKKVKTSPLKQLHVVETRNYMWDGLQTIAKPFVFEPNSPQTRSQLKGLMEQFTDQMVESGQINDARIEDKTSDNDVSNGIVRMKAHALMLGVAEYVELTVTSQIGESFSN